jgi:hypothetical protein
VFTIIGAPRGSPGTVPDCPTGKAGRSAYGPDCLGKSSDDSTMYRAPIYQAGTTVVVFSLDMSSSAYHIMAGVANPHLSPMY